MGDCYAAAGRTLMDRWMAGEADELIVVHGQPTLQVAPFCQYGHAWLEQPQTVGEVDGEVLTLVICTDAETGVSLPRELYYALGKIDPAQCFRYDWPSLRRWIQETGHWGPWEGPEACGPVPGIGEEEK